MKRRSFLSNISYVSAGLSGVGILYNSNMTDFNISNAINVGVIGTGSRGNGLSSIIQSIEGLKITAVCDILPFRLKEGIKTVNTNPQAYSDYRRLLDDKEIHAVIITTPFSTHAQIAMDALDAGKHVYCEKTLAKGYQDIDNLVKKVEASAQIFQTGHQYHSSRLYDSIVQKIQNGQVGKLISIESQWNRNGDWRRPVPDPKFEKMINWRMYRAYSGGLTAELCSHQIDFVNWVTGNTPEQVVGVGGIDYWKDGRETFDNVHLIYTYPGGIKAKFTSLTSNAKDGYQIKVKGDKGTIHIDMNHAWFYPEGIKNKELGEVDGVTGATSKWDENKGFPINIEHLEPSKQALIDFRDSIINNRQPKSDIYTGANTSKCVQMGIDAMLNNTPVKWDEFSTLN